MRFKWGRDNEYGQRWSILHTFLIPNSAGDKTYLKRIRLVQTPYFGLYLHWIYSNDSDRDPHDHPWNFWSFIVRGGYTERVWGLADHGAVPPAGPDARRRVVGQPSRSLRRSRFSLHRHPKTIAHIITDLDPKTITLVFVGRRNHEWGFWTSEGFVRWREYDRSGI